VFELPIPSVINLYGVVFNFDNYDILYDVL
jgi:hypothetical protein